MHKIDLHTIKQKMEQYEYSKEWDKCTYGLYLDSCRKCLFANLCRLEKDGTIQPK